MKSGRWRKPFLESLARQGIVVTAAADASITKKTAYNARNNDPDFAQQWDDAIDTATETLEIELRRRALDGVEEPVFYRGVMLDQRVRKYSDVLLMFYLKGLKPEKYRDNISQHIEGKISPIDISLKIVDARVRPDAKPDARSQPL